MNLVNQIKRHLKEKIDLQAALMLQEAILAEKAHSGGNPKWRLKCSVDRQRVSEKLDRLNAEILGLASMLRNLVPVEGEEAKREVKRMTAEAV
jgi:hypothetical protein